MEAWLHTATSALVHRGPDAKNVFLSQKVLFGSQRLRIHDLSPNADQPFYSIDESKVVVFNGAIFNFKDLKEELKGQGYIFQTNCDTEVVLYGLMAWGVDAFTRFDGMFSIAYYDRTDDIVLIGRDKLGIKPLYYYKNEDLFLFSSEIKPLLAHRAVPRSMNWDVVPEFMAYQFVAPPDTMFKDIYSVMPGQYVTVNLAADGLAKFGTYWRIDKNFLSANSAPELSRALSHSIDCAFDADRDVGIQLSGGIDSSLITAYSHDVLGYRDLNTYSVTMNDRETRYIDPRSEEKYMRIVNEQFAAHGHYYQYGAEEIRPALLEALWHHEAPLYGPSTCLYLLLAKSIKDKVTVLITGEGADDIFLGYFADWKFNGQPASLFKLFVEEPKMVELFGKNGYDAALAKRLDLASSPRLADMSILERASVLTIETVLHGLLARHDRMFMAQSIEGRPPFCTDQMLLSRFAMNDRDVHFNGIGKYAVKKLAEDYFDEDFVYRKKIGFSAPFGDWCSDPQYWRKYVNDVPEDFIGGFADPSPLRTQRNMPEGKEKWHMQNLNFVFSLTQLHLFHKIFFDATDPLSPDSWQQLVAH